MSDAKSAPAAPAVTDGDSVILAFEYVDESGKTHKADSKATFDPSETDFLLRTGRARLAS